VSEDDFPIVLPGRLLRLGAGVWWHLCPIMRLRVLGHRSVPVSVELIADPVQPGRAPARGLPPQSWPLPLVGLWLLVDDLGDALAEDTPASFVVVD
jgi:hypothetical protein